MSQYVQSSENILITCEPDNIIASEEGLAVQFSPPRPSSST